MTSKWKGEESRIERVLERLGRSSHEFVEYSWRLIREDVNDIHWHNLIWTEWPLLWLFVPSVLPPSLPSIPLYLSLSLSCFCSIHAPSIPPMALSNPSFSLSLLPFSVVYHVYSWLNHQGILAATSPSSQRRRWHVCVLSSVLVCVCPLCSRPWFTAMSPLVPHTALSPRL